MNWHKQSPEKPLYPDLIWSRPENRQSAGKLLIIGGNKYNFAAAADSYSQAVKAGIGAARVILPDSLKKTVGKLFEAGEFVKSTPSGSFARLSLGPILEASAWADGILIAGDLGHNSETAILIESLLQKSSKLITLTQDAADYISTTPQSVQSRPNTLLVLSLSQLQKMIVSMKYPSAITFSMDLIKLTDWLQIFTSKYPFYIVTQHLGVTLVAVNGEVSTTKLTEDIPIWRVKTATKCSVWWLQNSSNPFEALTTSIVV